MDHSPKKSKALIITIIAVIVLLIIGYFLFFRNNQLFGLKSTGDTSGQSNAATNIKNFVALLFKPKSTQTTGSPVNDTSNTGNTGNSSSTLGNGSTTTGGDTTTTPGSFGSGNPGDNTGGLNSSGGLGVGAGNAGNGGFGSGSYTPTLVPLPTPTDNGGNNQGQTDTVPQCSDGIDNNGDGLIDIKDPGCHTDFNAKNTTSYDPTINDESRTNPAATTTSATGEMCPSDDPLVFTDDEKSQLDSLLTQYYLIAPELKSKDDLALLNDNITTDQTLISQTTNLTQQCVAQKADPAYTGPQYVKDNPYYQAGGNTPSYVGDMTFVPSGNGGSSGDGTVSPYAGETAATCKQKYFTGTVTSEYIACLQVAGGATQTNSQTANTTPTAKSYGYFEDQFNIW